MTNVLKDIEERLSIIHSQLENKRCLDENDFNDEEFDCAKTNLVSTLQYVKGIIKGIELSEKQ